MQKPRISSRSIAKIQRKEEQELITIIHNCHVYSVLQPIVSLQDGSVFGYEALGRGPAGSPLENPEALMRCATKHCRLFTIEYLFRDAALVAARQIPAGLRLFINVNPNIMHETQFRSGLTLERLQEYSLSAEHIVFELTEREAVQHPDNFKRMLAHYTQQGYHIAIDDAGAGYSGLNLISDVQPHFVKLDMRLIRSINSDKMKQALVKGMQEFAKLTNTLLIAEGIETEAEFATLVALGVPLGQGYFIQRPSVVVQPIAHQVLETINKIVKKEQDTAQKQQGTCPYQAGGVNKLPPCGKKCCRLTKTIQR